jgi:predicted short-subunit dehydrogenase-like oxidoreductase (DUF2520 family)
MKVLVIGRSKVGRTLAAELGRRRHDVTLVPARRFTPRRPIAADLVVIASRDGDVAALAATLAKSGRVERGTAVVHVAGALGPEVLAPLRGRCAGVAQAHPLLSFASPARSPTLDGALLLVRGDRAAVSRARALARALGMTARTWPHVDPTLYHAAAALLANGAAALAAGATTLLERAGAPRREAVRALGPLLRSVAENVAELGLPGALTGPVRRGDVATVARHRDAVATAAPEVLPLYLASAAAQLDLSRALGDAPEASLDAIARVLRAAPPRTTSRGALGRAQPRATKRDRSREPRA